MLVFNSFDPEFLLSLLSIPVICDSRLSAHYGSVSHYVAGRVTHRLRTQQSYVTGNGLDYLQQAGAHGCVTLSIYHRGVDPVDKIVSISENRYSSWMRLALGRLVFEVHMW